MEFYMCDLDACNVTDIAVSCFQQGACKKLDRVAHPDCKSRDVDTTFNCGPIDKHFPSRWYLQCRSTGHVGIHIVGGSTEHMSYQLPPIFCATTACCSGTG